MSTALQSYIRNAGIGAAVPNMVINPALAWLTNRSMEPLPLSGGGSVVMDTAITCIVMTVIVTLFTASAARKSIEVNQIIFTNIDGIPGFLSLLPQNGWALGLTLGTMFALILSPLTYVLFSIVGMFTVPFGLFAVFKMIYTPIAAFLVARFVILRHVLLAPREQPKRAA